MSATTPEESLGRLVKESDYETLETIAYRLGVGIKLSADQRRDLSNLMRVVLNRATKVTKEIT